MPHLPLHLSKVLPSSLVFILALGLVACGSVTVPPPTQTPASATATATSPPGPTATEVASATATATPGPTSTPAPTLSGAGATTPAPGATAGPAPETVALRIEPQHSTVTVGETFEVSVRVDAGEQAVPGVQAFIDFDPEMLEALDADDDPNNGVQVVAGDALTDLIIINGADNGQGRISYAAGTLSNFPTGTFVLARIKFKALAATPSTPIAFSVAPADRATTAASSGGQDITGELLSGTVEIVE